MYFPKMSAMITRTGKVNSIKPVSLGARKEMTTIPRTNVIVWRSNSASAKENMSDSVLTSDVILLNNSPMRRLSKKLIGNQIIFWKTVFRTSASDRSVTTEKV